MNADKFLFRYQQMLKLIFILCFLLTVSAEPYRKIIHSTDTQAKCIDGSSPAMYVHQGSQKNKILIYLFGGGFCQGNSLSEALDSCYQRSKTTLGSTKNIPDTYEGEGYLSTNSSLNIFGNWTKILIHYCDGAFHQGYRKSPITYKNTNLYFRGQQIMRSHLQYISQHFQLSSAKSVVLTGTSAGAIGISLWSNEIQSYLKEDVDLSIILDSGYFLNYPSSKTQTNVFENQLINLFKISNVDSLSPNKMCNNHYGIDNWKCFLLQYSNSYIFGKKLFLNSEYDAWSIKFILQIDCLQVGKVGNFILSNCTQNERQQIEEYRKKYDLEMLDIVQNQNFWSISCCSHGYASSDIFYNSQNWKIPSVVGRTVKDAVQAFYGGQRVVILDGQGWPQNHPCSE